MALPFPQRRTFRNTSLVISILFLASSGNFIYAQQSENTSPGGTKYFLYTPPGYSTSGSYPLLVSLHGQVGIGNDLDAILQSPDETPAKLIHLGKWPSTYPFIVVSPQIPHDPSIPDNEHRFAPAAVDDVIEHVKSRFAVDANRIYFVGLSLGATGVWTYGAAYPHKVAAMVPISGVPDSTQGCFVKDIPVWVFHGEWDGLVRPVFATGMVNAINNCSPKGKYIAHLTLLNSKKHTGWNEIYNNTSNFRIYDWLLTFSRNDNTNKPPYVNAGKDLKILRRDQPLHLYGEYFDSDGIIANVKWTQTGGTPLTLEGTNTRFLTITNLVAGNFEFRLSVTDNLGKEKNDRVTVQILDQAASMPIVTDLYLVNEETDAQVAKLKDGYIFNPDVLGTNRINIRAAASSSSYSVRFRINSDHHLQTPNSPGPYLLTRHDWRIQIGTYLICATPFDDRGGRGNEGISQCYQIVVSTDVTPPPDDPVDDPDDPTDPDDPGDDPDDPGDDPDDPDDPGDDPDDPGDDPDDPTDPDNPGDDPDDPTDPDDPGDDPTDPDEPEAPTHFYSLTGKEISALSSWNSKADGTGSAPTSFSKSGQTFEITSTAVLNYSLNLGDGCILNIGHGGSLELNGELAGPVNLIGNAELQINSAHAVSFGTISDSSVITIDSLATDIPGVTYGHLQIGGSEATRTLAPGSTTVMGTFIVDDAVNLHGAPDGSSTLTLHSDVYFREDESFAPTHSFTLAFAKGGEQNFSISAASLSFQNIAVSPGTIVRVKNHSPADFHVGSPNGGGLEIAGDGKLVIGHNNLFIEARGTINGAGQTGGIAFRKANLVINSSSSLKSNLHVVSGADSLRTMVNDQAAAMTIHDPLYITDYVECKKGLINSNGNLVLVSTSEKNAAIKSASPDLLTGKIQVQHFIRKGASRRHLAFPVKDVVVSEIQKYIPITGDFIGASGNAGPSVFRYDDASGEWRAFPDASNTETFDIGRGYAFVLPDSDVKLTATGSINLGDFSFDLTANTSGDANKGWNLIGNPFTSPIVWSAADVSSTGIGSAAYVFDSSYPGGRYLVWDGETGDEEFGGLIPSGQGFFVRTIANEPALKIKRTAIRGDTASSVFRSHAGVDQLTLELRQDNLVDKAYLKFTAGGVDSLDRLDAVKLKNGYFSLSTLSADSIPMAINSLSQKFCGQAIGVDIDGTTPGAYSLSFSGTVLQSENIGVSFIDDFAQTSVDIREQPTYEFEVTSDASSYGPARFSILMTPKGEIPEITFDGGMLVSNFAEGNQWYLNGEPIPGATDATFPPVVSGEYTVGVSQAGCTRISSPVTFAVTDLSNPLSGIEVYPNPASLTLYIVHRPDGAMQYFVINSTGMSVLNGQVTGNQNWINIESLPSGVYTLVLSHGGLTTRKKLLVK